jgi:hypothetical protein
VNVAGSAKKLEGIDPLPEKMFVASDRCVSLFVKAILPELNAAIELPAEGSSRRKTSLASLNKPASSVMKSSGNAKSEGRLGFSSAPWPGSMLMLKVICRDSAAIDLHRRVDSDQEEDKLSTREDGKKIKEKQQSRGHPNNQPYVPFTAPSGVEACVISRTNAGSHLRHGVNCCASALESQ